MPRDLRTQSGYAAPNRPRITGSDDQRHTMHRRAHPMKTRTSRTLRTAAALTGAALTMTLIGCSSGASNMHAGDVGAIRGNPTPAMQTLARRGTDRSNNFAVMKDTNFRMLQNDIDKHILYTDRPSHLSSFPNKY